MLGLRASIISRSLLLVMLSVGSGCVVDATEGEGPIAKTTAPLTVDQEIAKASCSTSSSVVQGLSNQILEEISTCLKPGVLVPVASGGGLSIASGNKFMVKAAADALKKAAASKPGDTLNVSSMYRTVAEQYFIWRRSSCYPAVATPGSSNHETGIAVDISDPDNSTWRAALTAVGFKWLGSFDRFHFDYTGAGSVNLRGQDVLAFQRLWNRNNPADKIAEDGGWGPQTEARLRKSPATGFATGADCGPKPPVTKPWPKLEIDADAEGADRFSDGPSAAVPDVMEGDEYVVNLIIRNTGDDVAKEVSLGVWIEDPFVLAVHYDIESDWGTMPAGTFKLNDANDRPDNPPHDGPGKTFVVKMNNVSPKETKRIRMRMKALKYSIGAADAPDVRVWVQDVPGVYGKTDFAAPATNVDGKQTFNGGDLKAWAPVDIYSRTRWSFDGGMLEGWTEAGGAEVNAESKEKGLVVTVKADDPQIVSPETSFAASAFPSIKITATNLLGPTASRLYFATTDAPTFDETRTIDFTVPQGGKQSILVDLAQNPAWKGTITRLRIDPAASGTGSFEIDEMRMTDAKGVPIEPGSETGVPTDDAGNAISPDETATTGSCGCATAGKNVPRASLAWLAIMTGLALRRRRRS